MKYVPRYTGEPAESLSKKQQDPNYIIVFKIKISYQSRNQF